MESGNAEKNNGMRTVIPTVSMVPYRNTKVLYLIRHAEGFHNVAQHEDPEFFMSSSAKDAHLTERGWAQVSTLRNHIKAIPDFKLDLVVVSPMTRTLETACGLFGPPASSNSVNGKVLMKSQTGLEKQRVARGAIPADGCPPFVSVEYCREQTGMHPCDNRNSRSYYEALFPAIEFTEVPEGEDDLFAEYGKAREPVSHVKERALKFLDWIRKRPETHIAVVSHSGFLRHMCQMFGDGYGGGIRANLHAYFQNCELRTVTLIDEDGVNASDTPYMKRV